jgi:hypothetical protein
MSHRNLQPTGYGSLSLLRREPLMAARVVSLLTFDMQSQLYRAQGNRETDGRSNLGGTNSLLDRNQRELLVYHWHPESEGRYYPHLHVSASLNAQVDALTRREIDLDKLHIVTGPVSLQGFIRMLVTEFQIRPLRADWQARLEATPTH